MTWECEEEQAVAEHTGKVAIIYCFDSAISHLLLKKQSNNTKCKHYLGIQRVMTREEDVIGRIVWFYFTPLPSSSSLPLILFLWAHIRFFLCPKCKKY